MALAGEILTSDTLALRITPGKGRGVFAARDIPAREAFVVNPVLVLDEADTQAVEATSLGFYVFAWPFGPDGARLAESPYVAVAFGLISLVNDAPPETANASWECHAEAMVIVGYALRDIAAGEEIQWSYGWGG